MKREPMVFGSRARILDFARTNRLPSSFDVGSEVVREGGLISYGPVFTPLVRADEVFE